MAILQRTRILSNERVDLPDYNNLENFVCADFKAINKYIWTEENLVVSGFASTGVGSDTLSIVLAGSVAFFGRNTGAMYIGAPSLDPATTKNLTPGSVNYVEISLTADTGASDNRAFWDPTSNGGAGGEFSQIVDTYTFIKAVINVNTSAFTSDPDKIAICEVNVDFSGTISSIIDSRSMFYRLGRPGNLTRSYPWVSRVEPTTQTFTGADKDINTTKKWVDAVMDSIKEIKGTTYWYEQANASIIDTFKYVGLSTLVGKTNTAKFSWSVGYDLSITDDNPSPGLTDTIAALRVFTSSAELHLQRQDSMLGSSTIALADGEILWIELPDPLTSRDYQTIGIGSSNYKISARGSLAFNQNVYWLAYREGDKVYLRGLGELDPGESLEIEDTIPDALMKFLGFDPETATYVPYTSLPDPVYFGSSVYTQADHLVKAISTNTNNINSLAGALITPVYEEPLDVVAGLPLNSNEVQGPITAPFTLTLPLDSRQGSILRQYIVGKGILEVYLRGQLLLVGRDYNEVGISGSNSNQISILQDLEINDLITFRIDTTGGFFVDGPFDGVVSAANVGTGAGSFKQKTGGTLEFRNIKAGTGIIVSIVGNDIVITATGSAPTYPFFVNYITGQTTTSINAGGSYSMSTNALEVFRNGVHMINTLSIGDAIDRYSEASINSISLATAASSSDVFTFINQDVTPSYSTLITGQTGSVITVPTYIPGNKALRVYRNGVLLNTASLGALVDRYTEASPSTISLAQTAVSTDVFLVVNGPVPSSREDIDGQSTTVLNLSNAYVMGNQKLFVYRNGVLMLNTATLGSSPDRYQETSVTSITLATAATTSEVFTFIIE